MHSVAASQQPKKPGQGLAALGAPPEPWGSGCAGTCASGGRGAAPTALQACVQGYAGQRLRATPASALRPAPPPPVQAPFPPCRAAPGDSPAAPPTMCTTPLPAKSITPMVPLIRGSYSAASQPLRRADSQPGRRGGTAAECAGREAARRPEPEEGCAAGAQAGAGCGCPAGGAGRPVPFTRTF
jgi:hypothetical protein